MFESKHGPRMGRYIQDRLALGISIVEIQHALEKKVNRRSYLGRKGSNKLLAFEVPDAHILVLS
jgi:hypothetical protein